MHTTVVKTEDYGEVRIHHNGDWSGDAIVRWQTEIVRQPEGNAQETFKEVTLPGSLLIELSKKAAKEHLVSEIIGFVEQL